MKTLVFISIFEIFGLNLVFLLIFLPTFLEYSIKSNFFNVFLSAFFKKVKYPTCVFNDIF